MTHYAIQADALVREYEPGRGISGVSLAVEQGECFSLLGRNGSGKTTFTRLLLGLERAASGFLEVMGFNLRNGPRKHLMRIGAALDTSVHWDHLSGWENVYFVGRSYGLPRTAITKRLEELFWLADLSDQAHAPVGTYSYGMRRKLSLIQALCHDPALLVLDEPTGGVDAHFLLNLAETVRWRSEKGQTTFIAGNDPDWISSVSTRVGFMDSGRICAEGSVDALIMEVSPFQEVRIRMSHTAVVASPEKGGIRSFEQEGDALSALCERDPALVPYLVQWVVSQGGDIKSLEVRQTTLKDVFLLKTGHALRP